MRIRFFFLFLMWGLISCQDPTGIGKDVDVDPEKIYFDYKIWSEEDSDAVTVLLQFRSGGINGKSLEPPGRVLLDGEELKADSAKYSGAFYEATRPAENFTGRHTIVFVDRNKREHREEFRFEPFTLETELPGQVKKSPFTFQLAPFPSTPTSVQLVLIDTSFQSKDVNEEIVVQDGQIRINEAQLANLTKGPVTMEIFREEERPLRNDARQNGRILITYNLRRTFELVE